MRLATFALLLAAAAGRAAASEQEVRAAMADFSKAMVSADKAALERLLDDKLVYSHSNAKLESKADVIRVIAVEKNPVYQALEYAPDTQVLMHGPGTAVVRGNVTVKNTPKGGAPTTLQLNVLQVWVKGKGGWKRAARQSTRLP